VSPSSDPQPAGAPAAPAVAPTAPTAAASGTSAGAPPPLEVRGLIKRYGELTAVAGVDITVNTGDVYGYLGPNGAGKTTSLRMMLGLIRPTAGTVRVFGRDPLDSVHALAGVAGFVEAPTFYPYLNARRNLEMLAAYDGHGASERIDQALDTVELSSRAKDRVGGYSHGMRQRLGIAAALLREPKLLLLDEPATGLDPAGMRDMRLLIRRLAEQGMTVVLSSHLLAEVEDLCNRVAIVRSGRIVYEGEIATLKRGAATSYRLETTDDDRALAVAGAQPGITEAHRNEHGRIVLTVADEASVAALSQALVEAGALIHALAPQTVTLEDLFFSFTEGDAHHTPPDSLNGGPAGGAGEAAAQPASAAR
jgi:ABC-2 type transport system ATP-binding protein